MLNKALARYMLGLGFFSGMLYLGLNMVEQGMQELLALDGPAQSFALARDKGELVITFAARDFVLPYRQYITVFNTLVDSAKSWLVTLKPG